MKRSYSYDVSLMIGDTEVVSWRFKSINQALAFLHRADLGLLSPILVRYPDNHFFNSYELLNLFYGD